VVNNRGFPPFFGGEENRVFIHGFNEWSSAPTTGNTLFGVYQQSGMLRRNSWDLGEVPAAVILLFGAGELLP